ncbi:hypothetical protein KM043_018525 [Ampulex compressa]|nr:hypothetical protein KM043_018525 [Ampulex compressa]
MLRIGSVSDALRSKSGTSKLTSNLSEFLKGPNPNKSNAKRRSDSLAKLYDEYCECHRELVQVQPNHPVLDSHRSIVAEYFAVIGAVDELVLNAERVDNPTLNTSHNIISERLEHPSLPVIKLPSFNGNHLEWLPFKKKFVALVHSLPNVSGMIKYMHLESALSGSVLGKLADFHASNENDPKAGAALCKAYDQKRLLKDVHIDALLDLPRLSKADPDNLSTLIDSARLHLNLLEQVHEKVNEVVVVRILERCLSPSVSAKWQDRLDANRNPTFDELFKFIQNTIVILRSSDKTGFFDYRNTRKRPSGKDGQNGLAKVSKSSARALATTASERSASAESLNSAIDACLKCNGGHRLFRCPGFNKLKNQERYVVRLPFRDSNFELGKSKQQALKHLHSLLRRLEANPSLKSEYSKAMEEYLALGHMSLCEADDDSGWQALAEQLPVLREFSINRQILDDGLIEAELHGFCDASAHGYGACLFIRTVSKAGKVSTRLICSKSRVAPLSGVTIPRLELCAASVLKNLFVKVKAQLGVPIKRVVFWSDSTIVLCWLKKAPHQLRTFESNRVAEIQKLDDEVQWRHVRSKDNPADALSRGQLPMDFVNNTLWNSGPTWLAQRKETWPRKFELSSANLPGLKKDSCLLTSHEGSSIYSRFSSFQRCVRVVALMLRWRLPTIRKEPSDSLSHIADAGTRLTQIVARERPLLCRELVAAERRIIAMVQRERFQNEVELLATARDTRSGEVTAPFRKVTRLDEVNPFLEEHNITSRRSFKEI